jgi:hypothetical protein
MKTRDTAKPAPRKLALKKETLRRLTPSALRLVAGGAPRVPGRTEAWHGTLTSCTG